jgi:hypothetical protein
MGGDRKFSADWKKAGRDPGGALIKQAVGAGTKLDRDGSKLDSETEQNWIFEDLLGSDWY